jgi:anti-sigma factor RsiW
MSELDSHIPEEHAELAALADGTLPPERAAALEARIAESPELAAALAQQRQAVSILRQAVAETEAPLALRERLERDRQRLAAPRRRRRIFGLATAGSLAAVAVLAVMVGLSGGPGAPSVAEAAELGAKPPTAPVAAASPQLLNVEESGVAFPNWEAKFGWKAVGKRVDDLGDRTATTVYYRKGSNSIAYTIVSGKALHDPGNFAQVTLNGVGLKTFSTGNPKDVTWLRDGHSCVMTGKGVTTAKMLELASWKGQGKVEF